MTRRLMLGLVSAGLLGFAAYTGMIDKPMADAKNVVKELSLDFKGSNTNDRVADYEAGDIHNNPVTVHEEIKTFGKDVATYTMELPNGDIYQFIDIKHDKTLDKFIKIDAQGNQTLYDGSTEQGEAILKTLQEKFDTLYDNHNAKSVDDLIKGLDSIPQPTTQKMKLNYNNQQVDVDMQAYEVKNNTSIDTTLLGQYQGSTKVPLGKQDGTVEQGTYSVFSYRRQEPNVVSVRNEEGKVIGLMFDQNSTESKQLQETLSDKLLYWGKN